MIISFWILLALIFYTYLGYPLLVALAGTIKNLFNSSEVPNNVPLPEVSLLIAAYNEAEWVHPKMANSIDLDYPKEKLKIVWVTDGSNDTTVQKLRNYPDVQIIHQNDRKGKTAAINRAMPYIHTPFVVFCDANTLLDSQAIKNLMKPFADPKVGCVAGEKRIRKEASDTAAGSGEGSYWKYESWIKSSESKVQSTLAVAGELYAIRTELYQPVPEDTIIDDFVISLQIARQKYHIQYRADAFAVESPSVNIREELKRKIRIASGGIQTTFRYPAMLNPLQYGLLSLQYLSHKVLRWLVIPLAIPILLVLNLSICYRHHWSMNGYLLLLLLQLLFYLLTATGWVLQQRNIRWKPIFFPFYISVMNYAQIAGLIRFCRQKHSAVWDKAVRIR